MKLVIIALLAAATYAAPQTEGRLARILGHTHITEDEGRFRYGFDSSNGISVEAEGSPGVKGQINIRGRYRYPLPDGTMVEVHYVADENGYQVEYPIIHSVRPLPARTSPTDVTQPSRQDAVTQQAPQRFDNFPHLEDDDVGSHGDSGIALDFDNDEELTHSHSDEGLVDSHSDEELTHSHSDEGLVDSHSDEELTHSHSDEELTHSHSDEGLVDSHSDEGLVDYHSDEELTHSHSDEGLEDYHSDEEIIYVNGDEFPTHSHSNEELTKPHFHVHDKLLTDPDFIAVIKGFNTEDEATDTETFSDSEGGDSPPDYAPDPVDSPHHSPNSILNVDLRTAGLRHPATYL